jgi:hypothetical protein
LIKIITLKKYLFNFFFPKIHFDFDWNNFHRNIILAISTVSRWIINFVN